MLIHARLIADTHFLGRFETSLLLLHRNAVVPWFIVVPDSVETELLDLPRPVREAVLEESAQVATFVQSYFGSSKVNFAAIGNIVPQLHLHVVGRDPGDNCWPAPIWGNLTEDKQYPASECEAICAALVADYGLQRDAGRV